VGTSNTWSDLVIPASPVGNRMNASLVPTNAQQAFRLRPPREYPTTPIFSYAIFYNLDMEINPGSEMTVVGRAHSNQNIWATGYTSSSSLNFLGLVDAVGTIKTTRSPLDPFTPRSGNVNFENIALQNAAPCELALPAVSSSGPTGLLAALNPPPAADAPPNYAAAYLGEGTNYLENAVDLIISNPASGLAVTAERILLSIIKTRIMRPVFLRQSCRIF
jgi:hypothetical protein